MRDVRDIYVSLERRLCQKSRMANRASRERVVSMNPVAAPAAALLAVLCLALSACGQTKEPAAQAVQPEWPPKPTAEFLALDRKSQNLAVYDAFWQHMDANYYDPSVFATREWQARRAEWREMAAKAPTEFVLYHDVFPNMAKLMPESHVEAHPPAASESIDSPPPQRRADEKTMLDLAMLNAYGPGIDDNVVWRGHTRVALVGDVKTGSPAAEAGVPPGARLLRGESFVEPERKAIRFEIDYVPLDAAAARAWERGEGVDQPAAPETVRHATFDLRAYPWRKEIESRKLDGGVLYLRFPNFSDDTYMTPVYEAIDRAKPAGLIIDLRGNIGGMAVQLQKFSGALLGEGKFLAETRSRSETTQLLATAYPKTYAGPLVVLIGPGTGSAAEIFAAAVQDQKRGKVIGRLSGGGVLGQSHFPLPDAGIVSLPTWNLWRAGGKRIEGVGVEPDIWILPTIEDVRAGRDPVLERALREIAAPAAAK